MFFADLTDEERAMVEKTGRIREYQKDDFIILEGDTGSSLFLLKSGKAHVRKKLENEKYICLLELETGEMFGEMSFLALDIRSASVIAVEPCTVLAIERSEFQKLIDVNPVIGLKVYRCMAQEIARRLNRNTEELKRAMLWALEEMRGLDRCVRP